MALNDAPDAHWTGEFVLAPQTDNDGNVIGGGLVLPSLTTTERDAIASPRSGTVIYNSTTNKMNFRADSAWEVVTST